MRLHFAAALCGLLFASAARAQSFGPWHVLGRFDFDFQKQSIAEALPPEKLLKSMQSSESAPDLAATYKGMGGENVAWVKLTGELARDAMDVGALDLNALCPPPASKKNDVGNAVVYLYRRIDCASDLELPVQMGSDDGLRVWLDGALIVDENVARGLAVEDDFRRLKLHAGANHLLVKVSQLGGAYSFQIRAWERIPQQAINDAIDRGVQFLIQQQLLDGSWGVWSDYGGGHAAMTAYTLLKCGVGKDHPAVRMALELTKHRPIDRVYSLACLILALEATGDPQQRARLEDALAQLIGMQTSVGLFEYGTGGAPVDMSNTLYAALALRAAHKANAEIADAVWIKLAGGALRCLEKEHDVPGREGYKRPVAGFTYRVNEGGATGSMTTAGLSVLAMCSEALGDRMPPAMRSRCDQAKRYALAWIEHNLSWSVNPGAGIGHHYFWVYGVERVGALLELERIGDVDWYWDGAAYLLRAQHGDGSWNPENYVDHQLLDTQLALLFLKRATQRATGVSSRVDVYDTPDAQADVRLRATGDTPLTLWVSGLSDATVELSRAQGDVLDVVDVEYYARLEGDSMPPESIGRVAGAPAKRSELQRFALRWSFPRRGKWLVSARIHVRPGAADGAAKEPARTFSSPELAVKIDGVIDPARLGYGADLESNVLFGAKLKCEASSQLGDGEPPARVTDGNYATRWRSKPTDELPWIRITPERPLKGDRLLLSQALPRLADAAGPRVTKVDVVVNQKDHFQVTLADDVMAKTTVAFGQTVVVKELEVRVLECAGRKSGVDAVGFSEIELEKSR